MLTANQQQIDGMVGHAQAAAPCEACGILAGRGGRIEQVFKMRNTSDTPELCYLMDPKEQFKIMKEIRNRGLEMLAIYHSHAKSRAYPSAKDVELAYYPDAAYIIISLEKQPEAKAFRIVDGKIAEEEIEVR